MLRNSFYIFRSSSGAQSKLVFKDRSFIITKGEESGGGGVGGGGVVWVEYFAEL